MDHESFFVFKIEFKRGDGDPRRVFDSASSFIDALQSLDGVIFPIFDNAITSSILLEDVTAGSIRVKIATVLRSIDEDALKEGDWKRLLGGLLNHIRLSAIEFLDSEHNVKERLEQLKGEIKRAAESTDVKYLPDYPDVHEGRLLSALDKVQRAKAELISGDALILELEKGEYRVDISETWLPGEILTRKSIESIVKQNTDEMVLTIRKPDMIRDTLWKFSHGKSTISASMKDYEWLDKFRAREIPIFPGDALLCEVRFVYTYDLRGELKEQKTEIIRVKNVIKGQIQDTLPFDRAKY